MEQIFKIGRRTLQFSNLDKVLYPGSGTTKGDVIEYYHKVTPFLLPHLKRRPLTMKRYPDGVKGKFFYAKDAPDYTPAWVKTVPVPRSDGATIDYVVVNNEATLLWLANLANLELHTFLSRIPKLQQPTMMVFDLDPGEGAGFLQSAEVALLLRKKLNGFDLESFVKSSGSKGVQLYVPFNTALTFEETRAFAEHLAQAIESEHGDRVVTKMAKELRTGKVLIDWSQNSEHKTTVSVYSLRAKRDVPHVSMPLAWTEVEKAVRTSNESIFLVEPEKALRRLEKEGDLFAPVLSLKQKLPKDYGHESEAPRKTTVIRKTKPAASTSPGLRRYQEKRNFKVTSEPSGEPGKTGAVGVHRRFVIQKHAASHLHYDFRLERDGVLKSWAVPKGIPTARGERRLAVPVEDHPLDYASFEGTIPKGNYGGGTVMVWDYGTYEPLEEDWEGGKIKFVIHGKKLSGQWTLVRGRAAGGKKPAPWYLIKSGEGTQPISKRQEDESALTRRSMKQIGDR